MNPMQMDTVMAGLPIAELTSNLYIIKDIFLALILGLLFGYERSYHGRAAGMRTYGLVCMVSAALTAISGHPEFWFGGNPTNLGPIDPTRTVQGIVTGIGFLGAGIIMKDGLRISGLTTAASIWAASAIGILVGIGFQISAVVLTLLSAGFVMWGPVFGSMLPSRRPISVTLTFKKDVLPNEDDLRKILRENGHEVATGTVAISFRNGQMEWRFVAISKRSREINSVASFAKFIPQIEGVESYYLARARN